MRIIIQLSVIVYHTLLSLHFFSRDWVDACSGPDYDGHGSVLGFARPYHPKVQQAFYVSSKSILFLWADML